ncbi:MAG TPA: alpha/beta fold hydrolase [Kofleriaceae bacterium]|nr:alpha/beta fold hydrolase [Kofleriaceae bacterium]
MSFVVAALIALMVVAALVGVVLIRLRRAAARIEPTDFSGITPIPGAGGRGPPLPVVLVHGLFGFDRIGVPGVKVHYFRGIVKHLEKLGCHAHAVRLPASASVPDRAKILADRITALPHERVDIIAHSLGGLDARYALAKLGLASKVRALVTIGTPHRGTPLADLATDGALGLARKAIGALGLPLHALDWLSTSALERFNAEIKDVPGVRYTCVVGGIKNPQTPIALALSPIHAYLRRLAGPNDGLVPISSQFWGETLAEIEADHWQQVGWRMSMRGTFDALGMYAYIVSRLGDAPPKRQPSAA